jgi:hypothetical protein
MWLWGLVADSLNCTQGKGRQDNVGKAREDQSKGCMARQWASKQEASRRRRTQVQAYQGEKQKQHNKSKDGRYTNLLLVDLIPRRISASGDRVCCGAV